MAVAAPASNGIEAIAAMQSHSLLGDKATKFPRPSPRPIYHHKSAAPQRTAGAGVEAPGQYGPAYGYDSVNGRLIVDRNDRLLEGAGADWVVRDCADIAALTDDQDGSLRLSLLL